MKTGSYATRHPSNWVGNATSISFALLPLGVMLWAVPQTGIGFA